MDIFVFLPADDMKLQLSSINQVHSIFLIFLLTKQSLTFLHQYDDSAIYNK